MANTKTVKYRCSVLPIHWTLGSVHTSIVPGDTEVVPNYKQTAGVHCIGRFGSPHHLYQPDYPAA